jgi:hypothetical protein
MSSRVTRFVAVRIQTHHEIVCELLVVDGQATARMRSHRDLHRLLDDGASAGFNVMVTTLSDPMQVAFLQLDLRMQ